MCPHVGNNPRPQFKIKHNTQYMVKNFGAIWMDNWWVVFFIFHVIARTIVIIRGSLVRITLFGRTLRLNIRTTTRSLRIFWNLGLQLLNFPESLKQELMIIFCLGQRAKKVSTCICINNLYTTTRSRKWFEWRPSNPFFIPCMYTYKCLFWRRPSRKKKKGNPTGNHPRQHPIQAG